MRQDLTDITLIVDKSSSMYALADDTIGGLNAFIETQRELEGEVNVTTIFFNHDYQVVAERKSLATLPPFTRAMYQPEGNTALLDAVGKTIRNVGQRLHMTREVERPGTVIFVIMTDGMENCSQDFTRPVVAEMVERQQRDYNWQFIFLGANIDAVAEAASLNISANNAMKYDATRDGTQVAFATVAVASNQMRSGTFDSLQEAK